MSFRNSQSSSANIYNEAEGLISEALKLSNNDAKTALSLYQKAIILLIRSQNTEKKDYFLNFYKQRISDILNQIQTLQSSCGLPIMQLTDFNKLACNPDMNINSDIAASDSSRIDNSTTSLSLYPTLPDFMPIDNNFCENFCVPTINPTILDTNEFINQSNMPIYPAQAQFQPVPNSCQSQIINSNNYLSSPPSYNNNTNSCTSYLYNANPPLINVNNNSSTPFIPKMDYPLSIPTIEPQFVQVENKPLSQPGPNYRYINYPVINKPSSSFSDPNDISNNTKVNTQNFKRNDIINSIDHIDNNNNNIKSKDSKSKTDVIFDLNTSDQNSNDSLTNSKRKVKKNKKKHHHKSESTFNVSDKIINISQNFKIESLLGSGSFGNVYLATEYSSQKKFAIKELKDFESQYENSISFFREIEALTKADHPAVLHLYGFSLLLSKDKRYPAIVTEYLPGGTLLDVIRHKKTVTMTEKLILMYGICEAMHYLHDKLHIVHRDLKPENVMLNSNNEPIVCDFGLSKMISDDYMFQTQIAGSPCYMAPELLRDDEYSDKVDVYSYGIMCYELLSGKMAYPEAKNITELMPIVLGGKRPPLENENEIPQILKELISSCWNGNEALRPAFYEIALRFRKMEFVVDDCDKIAFRKYILKCLCRKEI